MIFQGLIIFINNIYIEICGLFYRTLLFWFVFFMTKKNIKNKKFATVDPSANIKYNNKNMFFFLKKLHILGRG